ncbi:MAG: class I adenylate-forming enzyme family protein [Pseudomonadota bacterium]
MAAETIAALLAERTAADPSLEAIVGDDGRLTYAELDDRSAAAAGWLVARGIAPGDRVALLAPNGLRWLAVACAVMRISAVLVPLSTLLRRPELGAQLAVAKVRALIAVDQFRGRDWAAEIASLDSTALTALRHVWSLNDVGEDRSPAIVRQVKAMGDAVRPDDDMAVLFTSGSSGTPKGAIHTHGGALRATAAGVEERCIRHGTRLYLPMPFFWMGGFGGGIISALVAGATLLTEAAPDPERTLAFISREGATLFRGWPDQAAQIAAHPDFARTDLSKLTAGSLDPLLPPALRSKPGSRAKLFGMTESFGPYCGYPLDRDMPTDKWGSCGRPFAGTRLRIVDPETQQVLAPHAQGSIQIAGANLMRGFCGRDSAEIFTADGWYDTGDFGHVDENGFLYYVGRRDDMIKLKGATVYPSEVEAALVTIPGVNRALATDLIFDNAVALGAVVIADPATMQMSTLVAEAKQRLSAFKVPTHWAILDSIDQIPTTGAGKVDKPALRSLLLAAAPR